MTPTSSARADEPKRLIDVVEMADRSLLTREQAQAIIAKVTKASSADEVTASLGSRHTSDVRFAANQLSTSGGVWNTELVVTSSFGKRHGTASTNDLSDACLMCHEKYRDVGPPGSPLRCAVPPPKPEAIVDGETPRLR